jgi:hypothetical protein
LAYISLRGLQGIQLEIIFFDFFPDVSGKVAGSFRPFYRRLTISLAIGTYFVTDHSITSLAGFHDGITSPTVVGTACLLHEDTFCSHFDGLTNHGNLPPFSMSLFFQYIEIIKFCLIHKKAQKKELPTFGNSIWF